MQGATIAMRAGVQKVPWLLGEGQQLPLAIVACTLNSSNGQVGNLGFE